MADVMGSAARWDESAYQRFADAQGHGHDLEVRFENGDVVRVDLRALLNTETATARWDTLQIDPFELRVMVDESAIEVPWLDVRALSDDELANHLASRAHDQAQHVGHQVRLLRERRRMTSRELAERAGISPQSLSRIERGRHDVVFSTLRRLLAAMNFELTDLASMEAVEINPPQVRAALIATGLARDTVDRVLYGANDAASVLARVRNIFGWAATDLAGPGLPPVLGAPAFAGRRKEQARDRRAAMTYVLYAHKVALLADQASERPSYRRPPDDPKMLGDEIREEHGDLRFESVAHYCWDHGIAIVPLVDRGQFHGACWLIGDRPVILLKQTNALDSRWVFDLGHELFHVLHHLDAGRDAIIEFEEIGHEQHDAEEEASSDFSETLQLGDADRLAQAVVSAAGGNGQRIWKQVEPIATREGVHPGVLANYMAYRLAHQGISQGWGAAANLQREDQSAPQTARRLLLEHIRWERLTDDDALVLEGALSDADEEAA
jgi:transcriptional regulator with XRE-family HTH domain